MLSWVVLLLLYVVPVRTDNFKAVLKSRRECHRKTQVPGKQTRRLRTNPRKKKSVTLLVRRCVLYCCVFLRRTDLVVSPAPTGRPAGRPGNLRFTHSSGNMHFVGVGALEWRLQQLGVNAVGECPTTAREVRRWRLPQPERNS